MTHPAAKLTPHQAWSMAIGGMIGGGIFSTLGIVVAVAGAWAWLSFLFAGLIALAAGYSYVKLASHYDCGGGAYTYLRAIGAHQTAATLAWVLIVGYVLTNAVYAYTFGHYLSHMLGTDGWVARFAAITIMLLFVGLNLRGVSDAGWVEVGLVWLKLVVLALLAGFGLWKWQPHMLSDGVTDHGILAALFGASAVFMAYEGFQLLAYDYEEIDNPSRVLPKVVISSICVVMAVYVLVTLGATMLIGAPQVISNAEVALAAFGSLTHLVEAASLAFLVTFSVVCALAWRINAGSRLVTGFGVVGGALSAMALMERLVSEDSQALIMLGMLVAIAIITRWVTRRRGSGRE